MSEEDFEVGHVTHYFAKIGVAVVELCATLKVGDHIAVKGATTDFEQEVVSMQIEHEDVAAARSGQLIGLKVEQRVRDKDVVYKKL